MKKSINKGVAFYTFDNFEQSGGTTHCFSTKVGGVSTGCYESMNLSFNRNDERGAVMQNFINLSGAVGFSHENMVFSDQVHETKVVPVGAKDRGKGITRISDIKAVDGIMTNEENVVLTTFYADCVPLFFYDSRKRVIALSHAGWKGTLNKIGEVTVEEMYKNFGCAAGDIIAGIGPSIGKCCFEVDSPVAVEFRAKLDFADEYIESHKEIPDKYFIDLWGINKQILINAGIKEENIELSGLCTKCNHEIFYSHRVCGSERGSLAAFLQLDSVGDGLHGEKSYY